MPLFSHGQQSVAQIVNEKTSLLTLNAQFKVIIDRTQSKEKATPKLLMSRYSFWQKISLLLMSLQVKVIIILFSVQTVQTIVKLYVQKQRTLRKKFIKRYSFGYKLCLIHHQTHLWGSWVGKSEFAFWCTPLEKLMVS